MSADQIETKVLQAINDADQIADSGIFAAAESIEHLTLVGVIKSLAASELILVEVRRAARNPPHGHAGRRRLAASNHHDLPSDCRTSTTSAMP